MPINCKTGEVCVHSEGGSADQQVHYISIWICTDVLEHAVLPTAVSTQTSDVCDVLTWLLWKQC